MGYPSTPPPNLLVDKIDFTDTVVAEHINTLQTEVLAIETNLGTFIKTGSGWVGEFDQVTTAWNTLKDRLANIEYGLNTAYAGKLPTGGTTGQVLVKSSGSNYATTWATGDFLPSQSTNTGKFLTTNGSSASWSTISQVPSVSGNTGKYLTTDGSTSSWGTINQVPSISGNSGKYLYTDGSTTSWATVSSGSGSTEFTLMMMGA